MAAINSKKGNEIETDSDNSNTKLTQFRDLFKEEN